MPSRAEQKIRQIGPFSRPLALVKLDGRTREAMLMRAVREDLIAHVGGRPTAAQAMLIERAVILALKCAQLDAQIIEGGRMSLHATNHAIAWQNAFRRTIVALGVEPTAAPQLDPIAVLNAHLTRERRHRRTLDDEVVA